MFFSLSPCHSLTAAKQDDPKLILHQTYFFLQIFPMIVAPNWIQLDERRRHQMGLVPIKLVPLARISWLSTFQQIFIYKICHSWWKCGTAELQLKSSFQIRIFFSVHCFRDFRRLGKSLSKLWSNREEESEEVRCQYKGNSRTIQRLFKGYWKVIKR